MGLVTGYKSFLDIHLTWSTTWSSIRLMIRANVHQIKTHFSEYLAQLEQGETVVICKRNVPIAEMHSIFHQLNTPRPIGLAKDKFTIPPSFFEPLPDDIIDSFEQG